MKRTSSLVSVCTVLAAFAVLPSAALAEDTPSFAPVDPAAALTGRTVVDLADDVGPSEAADLAARYGVHWTDNSPALHDDANLFVGALGAAQIEALGHDPRVEGLEPETLVSASFVPNDPKYATDQWHLTRVGAESAWEYGCGRGVTVAVIDTGVACFDKGPFTKGTDLAGTRCKGKKTDAVPTGTEAAL